MADKSFWVIESARTTYWDGKQVDTTAHFTPQIADAIKFADFQSAETVRCWLLEKVGGSQILRSTEHMILPADAPTNKEKA